MYRRDRFNEDLVRERCAELIDLDRRIEEVEGLLDVATNRAPGRRCSCGADLPPLSRFCPQCGLAVESSTDEEAAQGGPAPR
jgi:hypothetical protein